MRDEPGDRTAGVNTLAVRFGVSRCHPGIFMAMSLWVTVLLWCFASGLIDGKHFMLLSRSALVYPLVVWLATERSRLSRTASNYLIVLSQDLGACRV